MRVENAEGAYKATRHVIDLGHRRIVQIAGLSWHAAAMATTVARTEAGLPIDPSLIVQGDWEGAEIPGRPGAASRPSGRMCIR